MDEQEPEKLQISLADWLSGSNSNDKPFDGCEKCGCRRNKVIKTISEHRSRSIIRRRKCEYCGHEFLTTEKKNS